MVLAVVILGLTVSTGYSVYSLQKQRSAVHMPIQADENLANESGRITRVNLKLAPGTDAYVWDIELMERACAAARLGGVEELNVLRAGVDPVTGEVLNISTRTGVVEEPLSKERCMEGCHKPGESPGPQV